MAYTQRNFVRDLALWSTATLISKRRQQQMLRYAARKGIQLAGIGATRAAPAIGAAALAHPFAAGTALGVGALATPPGQDLLAAAEEHGRQSRILYERAQQQLMTAPQRALMAIEAAAPVSIIPVIKKRALTKFNQSVRAGMKIVKASPSYGKKGTINVPKKAFAAVNKVISNVNKGKKITAKGVLRKVALRAKKIIGKPKPRKTYISSLRKRLRIRK